MAFLNVVLVSIAALLLMVVPADAQSCSSHVTNPQPCAPSGQQRSALLAMKAIIAVHASWAESTDGAWEGLECATGSTDIGCMTAEFNNFNGDFTTVDLSAFTSLKYMKIGFNSLRGSLPTSISALTNLEYLNLNSNRLTGTLQVLSSLTSLKYLILFGNTFSGTIPYRFACLTDLLTLNLDNNQLTGKLPSTFTLPELSSASIKNNQLWGSIPAALISYYNDRAKPLTIDISTNYLKSSFVVPSPAVFDSGVFKTFTQNCFTSVANQKTTTVCDAFYLDKNMTDVPADLPSCG